MKDSNYVQPKNISLEVEGKVYQAKYFIKGNLLRVMSQEFGTEVTRFEDPDVDLESLAKKMLEKKIKS